MKAAIAPPRAWIALIDALHGTAFALSYLEDKTRRVTTTIPAGPVRTGQLVHTFQVESSITSCHHFYGIRIRPEKGRDCPKGKVEVRIDQTPMLRRHLRWFAEDRDPLLIPWKDTNDFFWAAEMTPSNEANGKRKLGYMLPNGIHVEVWVEVEPLDSPLKLEVEVLMNLYNAGTKGAPKL